MEKNNLRERNYVYLLRCADEGRIAAHNNGTGAKYTKSRRPVELVYFEEYENRHEALSREWHIKRLSREEKLHLLEKAGEET